MNFLVALCLVLILGILITLLIRALSNQNTMTSDVEHEVESTTTTTTHTAATVNVADLPPLARMHKENGQPFCVDPVDGGEWMLNTNDDIYEDASGKWWRLT